MINVLLIEKYGLLREGITALIHETSDIRIVGTADNAVQAITERTHLTPDVILMGVDLPGRTGVEQIEQVKQHYPSARFVMLISEVDQELVIRAVHIGVDGLLLNKLYARQLSQALRDAVTGQYVLSGEIAEVIVRSMKQSSLGKKEMLAEAMEKNNIHVSDKHVEVAFLLTEGYSNKQIAQQMQLQETTIRTYVSDLYREIGIRNRAPAIAFLRDLAPPF